MLGSHYTRNSYTGSLHEWVVNIVTITLEEKHINIHVISLADLKYNLSTPSDQSYIEQIYQIYSVK